MKKLLALTLAGVMMLSLAACTKKAEPEVLTGKADGFGGVLTVEVTKEGDKITNVAVIEHSETDGIGTPAIEALPAAIVEANGTDGVDVIADATVTSNAIIAAVNNALDPAAYPYGDEAAGKEETAGEGPVGEIGPGLRLGQARYAAHGKSAFANTYVVLNGDVIVDAYIDEFQFMAIDSGVEGVPNADNAEGFAAGFADPERILVSKRQNNTIYSANMAEKNDATMELAAGYDSIQTFVKGKTVAELEALVAKTNEEVLADVAAVADCTLVDARGYICSVIEAARNAATKEGLDYANADNVKLGVALYAAHGTKCFTVAAAVVDGDTIVLSSIDEFQIMSGDVVGVPNSTQAEGFGAYIVEGSMLVSKTANDELYSANMTEKNGATMKLSEGWALVYGAVNGKTIAEAEALTATADDVDAIADCTLVDEKGYINAIIAAAKAAK